DHIGHRGCDRWIARSHAAEATEMMECPSSTELVRRKGVLALEKTESIGRNHVVEVALASTNRTIAFTHACKVCSNLEPNTSAVTGPLVGFHLADGSHASLPSTV